MINRQYYKHLNEFTFSQLKFIEKKHNKLKLKKIYNKQKFGTYFLIKSNPPPS